MVTGPGAVSHYMAGAELMQRMAQMSVGPQQQAAQQGQQQQQQAQQQVRARLPAGAWRPGCRGWPHPAQPPF
jgi:hypothetical protein